SIILSNYRRIDVVSIEPVEKGIHCRRRPGDPRARACGCCWLNGGRRCENGRLDEGSEDFGVLSRRLLDPAVAEQLAIASKLDSCPPDMHLQETLDVRRVPVTNGLEHEPVLVMHHPAIR